MNIVTNLLNKLRKCRLEIKSLKDNQINYQHKNIKKRSLSITNQTKHITQTATMSQLPEEIIDRIFTYAFYPHQYSIKKYIDYNMCLADLPTVKKEITFVKHPIYTYPFAHFKHTLNRFGKTIAIDQCEIRCNYFLME